MSGRSAYVRKEKTKVKDSGTGTGTGSGVGSEASSDKANSIIGDFPLPSGAQRPAQFDYDFPPSYRTNSDVSTSKPAHSTTSDDLAYARVRKPQVPVLDVSGIEKSSFRSLMDKKSEGVRKGLAKTFGKKKKGNGDEKEPRPPTSATIRPDSHELDASDYLPTPSMAPGGRVRPFDEVDHQVILPAPPTGKLPPIPQGPQLKRWVGSGRAPQPWNKLRKDPELWDPSGDTLVFFGHETHHSPRPPPSFRVSSHMLEATESQFLINVLREGNKDDESNFSMPPSPMSSPGFRAAQPVGSRNYHQPTPPMSEASTRGYDGQISYDIYFLPPINLTKEETLRHQITTRNILALLYNVSLVGQNLYQALIDLYERAEAYMPQHKDAATMIIEYIVGKGFDDVRDNPAAAAALLGFCEHPGIRWEEGWRECFVHCAGMYGRLEKTGDFRFVSTITRALLERASLEVQVRVHNCELRLEDFDFSDMWPIMGPVSPPSRAAFERLQKFFLQFYQNFYQTWPPTSATGHDQWLTRRLAQKLQKDFGALYDYLVNRDIVWDGSEERSGRKWNIIDHSNRSFTPDSSDCPITDILIAFDNRHQYPHIPHPYPLVPEPTPTRSDSRDNLFKANKRTHKPAEDKMAERKAALAYTDATNIYRLGSAFVTNELVDAFTRFEKTDKAADVDPFEARRGRWILIYGILQTLASVSVDTPHLHYATDVEYHLSPNLKGTPPWISGNRHVEEANHVGSHCWIVRDTWVSEAPVTVGRRAPQLPLLGSIAPSVSSNDDASTTSRSQRRAAPSTRNSSTRSRRHPPKEAESPNNYSYDGAEDKDEWPIVEEAIRDFSISAKQEHGTRSSSKKGYGRDNGQFHLPVTKEFVIKDFDNYEF